MEIRCRPMTEHDIVALLEFENKKRHLPWADASEPDVSLWSHRARRESLDFYSRSGWSFIALDEANQVIGFVLAQPLSFFGGYTQSLWVEYLSAGSLAARDYLIDLMINLAKTQHFQGVFFPADDQRFYHCLSHKSCQAWQKAPLFIKTTEC